MLLTLTTTAPPATDLGYLLHKHPDRLQPAAVSVGTAHVFYPEAAAGRCTAALLLEVDPIALVRGRKAVPGEGFALGQYVNDRPYAASSMLAMAMKEVFRTAFTGRCAARPELAAASIPLEITVPALSCRGGAPLVRRVFGPLGWQVEAVTRLADRAIEQVVAVDVSVRALQHAARRLRLESMSEPQRQRVQIFQSALTYRDDRLAGLDAAVLMEVIEHVDPPRLAALERAVFGHAAPGTVVVTTPNAEYNVRFAGLAAGAFRHRDHRFEWTRGEFRDWAGRVAGSFGYQVRFLPVGDEDTEVGPPTQLAVFSKAVAA